MIIIINSKRMWAVDGALANQVTGSTHGFTSPPPSQARWYIVIKSETYMSFSSLFTIFLAEQVIKRLPWKTNVSLKFVHVTMWLIFLEKAWGRSGLHRSWWMHGTGENLSVFGFQVIIKLWNLLSMYHSYSKMSVLKSLASLEIV